MKLAVILVVLATSVTHAEPPGLVPPIEADTAPVDSYRLQTFAVDAAAFAMLAGSGHHDNVAKLAVATYLLAAPAVHVLHGRANTAIGSVALRIGMPLGFGLIGGAMSASSSHEEAGIAGAAIGALVGGIAASAIDIGMLSKGERRRVVPVVTPTTSGMAFGVVGRF